MSKFEYSDFYKFIASVGIALITLSVLVPWLFLREPFDLLQKSEDIKLLLPIAQSIIHSRQSAVQVVITLLPYFTALSFALGFIALVVGGVLWLNRTQKLLDKLNELNVKTLEKQLTASSPEESKAQHEEEIKAQFELEEKQIFPEVDQTHKPDTLHNLVENALRVERRFTGLLVSCFARTYTILTERRLGPVSLDVVMLSKASFSPDFVFEVKYVRKGFKYNWLRDNVIKIVYANQVYQQETKRSSTPVLVIVGHDDMSSPSTSEMEKYSNQVQSELEKLGTQAIIVFLFELEFYNMDCATLKAKIRAW